MNRNAQGTWLQGQEPEAPVETDPDQASATIKLPEVTPTWNDSTVYIQRIHEALVAKGWGWGRGPI